MPTDLVSNLQKFLKDEKIKIEIRKTSDSNFWLENPNGFISIKFFIYVNSDEILYDVFSPKYDVHFRLEDLRDVEKLDFLAEETRREEYEKSIEDMWLILDCVKLWAEKNGFRAKETRLI
jgi:hypothetical protein